MRKFFKIFLASLVVGMRDLRRTKSIMVFVSVLKKARLPNSTRAIMLKSLSKISLVFV